MIDFNIKIFNELSHRPAMDIPMKFTILDSITAFVFNLKTLFFLFRKGKSHSMIRDMPVKCSVFRKWLLIYCVHLLHSLRLTSMPLCIIAS